MAVKSKAVKSAAIKALGVLKGNYVELREAGCIQTHPDAPTISVRDSMIFFKALMAETSNNPCDGCPGFKGGKCGAFRQYHTAMTVDYAREQERQAAAKMATVPQGTGMYPGMSVRAIAKQRGVSIKQVRRMKATGEI